MSSLPAVTSDKDESLSAALSRMIAEHDAAIAARATQADTRAIVVPGSNASPAVFDPHITAIRRLPAAAAALAPFPDGFDPRLRRALQARGIAELYTHQARAVEHALAGRNVVVVTPTASGKTLCYNAPVLHSILTGSATRALYLFPTKALAQDQLAELHQLVQLVQAEGDSDIGVFTYDGDTPQDARRAIRARAHVVLSNPDMLHAGILPHHPRWAKLFENLRFVVIDELHAYRGVFGSHLANIVRRLRRICRHYGSDPTFICSSATIANPRELAERLVGKDFEIVDRSGAPQGEKYFVFVNPPVVNRELGIRRSYLAETRRVAIEFLRRGLQMIVFAQSRLSTEILTTYLKDAFETLPGTTDMIRGYRGGYLPAHRREIERGLRSGEVRCVVSTNALELGIDIGALDVSIMAGYPGTIASTWQRAGRSGRRQSRSAAILVASSAPIDQFIVRNPEFFFGASPEHALVNPDNLHILLDHVKCAAFELPFGTDEAFGTINVQEILFILSEDGFVQQLGGQWQWTQESYPADAVSLRSVTSDNFVVVDITHGEQVIGETDFTSGPSTLHEKAIYLVEGRLFQIDRLDYEGRKAYARQVECDYYTDAITHTKVTILETFVARGVYESVQPADSRVAPLAAGLEDDRAGGKEGGAERTEDIARAERAAGLRQTGEETVDPASVDGAGLPAHGEVHVVSRVVGFKKIKFYTNENVGSGELELPEQQMHTTSYWLTVPTRILTALPYTAADRRDGVLGMAYAMYNVASLLMMCDRHDLGLSIDGTSFEGATRIGGTVKGEKPELSVEPRIFLYDNYPGGIGFSEPLFGIHEELLAQTLQLVEGCPCDSGCPSCVGPEGATGPLAKTVASRLLRDLASPAL